MKSIKENAAIAATENTCSNVNYVDSQFEYLAVILNVVPCSFEYPFAAVEGFWINSKDREMHGIKTQEYWVIRTVKIGGVSYLVGARGFRDDEKKNFGLDVVKKGAVCLIHYLSKMMECYEQRFSLKFRLKGYFEALLFRIIDESQIFNINDLCWGFKDIEKKMQSLSIEQISVIESASSLKKVFIALTNYLGIFDVYGEDDGTYEHEFYNWIFKSYYRGYRDEVRRMKKVLNY